jgi:drug/metabolite transporter (DMT)-like permease
MVQTPNRGIELALLALLAALWGSSYLFIRVAVATIPPTTLIALRVAIAAVVLLAVLHALGMRLPRDAGTWRLLLVQAFLNSIASWTLLAWGQQYVASGLAGVLNSTSPVFVFLFTRAITRHETTRPLQLAGALFGVLGVALIVGLDVLDGIGTRVGAQLAILVSAMLYACAAIHGRRLGHLPPLATAAGTLLWATLWLVPASLMLDRPWLLSPSTESLAAALALALLGTAAALLLYFRLLRTLGSMGVASQSYLRAGFSVLLGAAVLGETIDVPTSAGLAAVVLGVAAINYRRPA